MTAKAFKYLERLNNKFDDTKIKFAYKYQTLFRDKNKNDRKRIAEELVELAAQDSEIHYFLGHYYLFGKNLFNFLTPFNHQVRDYKKAKFHLEKYINREFRYYEFTAYENLALRELGEIYFGVFENQIMSLHHKISSIVD